MSRGLLQPAVRNTWVLPVAMVILPAVMCAAESNAPSDRGAAPARKDALIRPATSPATPSVRAALRTPAAFTPQMPLSEAIDILRNCTRPPLKIVVLWRSLYAAGIHQDTPIGVDGLAGLRVGQYLDMLVHSLSAGAADRIGYTVGGGVITIGTASVLPAPKLETRVHDISDLVAPPANYGLLLPGSGGIYGNPMMGLPGGSGMAYGPGFPSTPGGPSGAGGVRSRIAGGSRSR